MYNIGNLDPTGEATEWNRPLFQWSLQQFKGGVLAGGGGGPEPPSEGAVMMASSFRDQFVSRLFLVPKKD